MVRRKRQREADRRAVETDKRRRSTWLREQAERNRDDVRSAGDSVRVILPQSTASPANGGMSEGWS